MRGVKRKRGGKRGGKEGVNRGVKGAEQKRAEGDAPLSGGGIAVGEDL